MDTPDFYNKWAEDQLENKEREPKLKWKAVNLLGLLLRNGAISFNSVCEIGGSEGIVLDTIAKVLNPAKTVNYEISSTFCETGRNKFQNITYINKDFLEHPEYYDLVILSDIVEHVENDDLFLNVVSKFSRYLVIKIPIEKSLFSSEIYHILRFKKIPENMKYGKNHINGHLRGYNVRQAMKYISKYYRIIDSEISDVSFFNPSKKKKILKRLLGLKFFVLLYGGALFAFAQSRELSKNVNN